MQFLSYFPGQEVTVLLETVDADSIRADGYLLPDGYILPIVSKILKPNLTYIDGYPFDMTKLEVGVYYYKFTLPTGASAVGSYIVDVTYLDPADSTLKQILYQIVVTAPYGNFGATAG